MSNVVAELDSAQWRRGNAAVCKTAIQGFDSPLRLRVGIVERQDRQPNIVKISQHALDSVMIRWGLGIVDARLFIEGRIVSASDPVPHKSAKKAHRNKFVFKSGDATLIAEKKGEGFNIITVMRQDRVGRKMMGRGLLRKKVR